MGLLKGVGRRLNGLFADGGLVDALAEAQAWLDGDYERGMHLGRLNRRARRPLEKPKVKSTANRADQKREPYVHPWLAYPGDEPWVDSYPRY